MWVRTSTTRCFRCLAPAPIAARTWYGVLLAEADLGHRELRGFVPPAAAAAGREVLARPGQPAPWPARGALPPPAGPAGRPLPPPPPPPPLPARGQSRGRTGAGAATYAPNATCDICGIDSATAAGDYRGVVVLRLRSCLVPPGVLPGVPDARSSPAVGASTFMVALTVVCALLVGVRPSAVPTRVLLPPGFVPQLLRLTTSTPRSGPTMSAGSRRRAGRSTWGPRPAWRVRCFLSPPRLQPVLSLSPRSSGWSGGSTSSALCPLRR